MTRAQRFSAIGAMFTVAAVVVIVGGQGSATSTSAGIVVSVVAIVAHGVALRLWFADRRADAGAGR
jgi:preprotein translocase subunit SecY